MPGNEDILSRLENARKSNQNSSRAGGVPGHGPSVFGSSENFPQLHRTTGEKGEFVRDIERKLKNSKELRNKLAEELNTHVNSPKFITAVEDLRKMLYDKHLGAIFDSGEKQSLQSNREGQKRASEERHELAEIQKGGTTFEEAKRVKRTGVIRDFFEENLLGLHKDQT